MSKDRRTASLLFPGAGRGPGLRKPVPYPSSLRGLLGSGVRRGTGNPETDAGFTLIEMLVALAIFSLAALALLRLSGATATNSARLQEQGIAQLVAENLAVETLTDPGPPPIGAQTGQRQCRTALDLDPHHRPLARGAHRPDRDRGRQSGRRTGQGAADALPAGDAMRLWGTNIFLFSGEGRVQSRKR